MTPTAPVYKCERLNRLIRKWHAESETAPWRIARGGENDSPLESNDAPEIVERCAALKLELVLMLSRKILGYSGYGSVEDDYGAFEWGAGGMTHLHSAMWVKNAPRTDVVAENEKARDASGRGNLLLEPDVVNQMAGFSIGIYLRLIRRNMPRGKKTASALTTLRTTHVRKKTTHSM